jgi:hypothetical protein
MHLLLLALPAPALAVLVFLKPYAWYLALGLVSLLLSRRSRIDAWAESQPRLAGFMKLLRGRWIGPLGGARSGVPHREGPATSEGDGRQQVDFAAPARSAGALLLRRRELVPGRWLCRHYPRGQGRRRRAGGAPGLFASAVVLTELVRLDADWMASLTDQGSAAAAASTAKKVSALLDAATAALARAKPYLATGKDAALAKQELTTALQTIEDALELLAELGKQPSPETLDALGYLHGFLLGGAS